MTHLSLYQLQTSINAVASSQPVSYDVNDVRTSYTATLGRLSITPNINFETWRYANTVLNGVLVDQSYRDYDQVQAGVLTTYSLNSRVNLDIALRGIGSNYIEQPPGEPSRNSTGFILLAGLDDSTDPVWRYRLLAGVEQRNFASSAYSAHTAPVAEAAVIWSPTRRTTVTGTLLRAIENASDSTTAGYVYTLAKVQVDHEYRRDLILLGYVQGEQATLLQNGGQQVVVGGGLEAVWLMNRNVRLHAAYDLQKGQSNSSGSSGSNYTRNELVIRLEFSL
jgi:hypothetical protein